jgi:two-component system, LytTR family, sensor kinase
MIDKAIFVSRRITVIGIIVFYLFFMSTYYATLTIASYEFTKGEYVFEFKKLIPEFIDYGLKFLITMPIWYLIFRKFKNKALSLRLSIHILTLPLFVLVWQRLFYFILESFGYNHLSGYGQAWDIYIPGLFYFIQFGVLHAFEYYNENLKQQKIQLQLREASLKSELSALKSQLNPHFLYNVFNTINASVPKELETTRQMIATLSDMFRYQLQASQSDFVTISEEINFVKQYLDLEKARFENRLTIVIDVDQEIMERKIAPMIIQPLVENAVKHGLSPEIAGGEVRIRIHKVDHKLHFMIADTGVGVPDKTVLFGKGVGLTNIQFILDKMYNSTLKVSDNVPKGLKIEFII